MRSTFFISLALLFSLTLFGQTEKMMKSGPTSANSEEEFEAEYKRNIRKSKINGIYIPKDLEDAFREIIALSPEESLVKFKAAEEKVVARKLYHGLGKWMIAKWNFYSGSRLSHQLKNIGLSYPDDMAQFILRAFHRHLNNVPIEQELLASEFIQMRDKEHQARLEERKVISTETRKIPKN